MNLIQVDMHSPLFIQCILFSFCLFLYLPLSVHSLPIPQHDQISSLEVHPRPRPHMNPLPSSTPPTPHNHRLHISSPYQRFRLHSSPSSPSSSSSPEIQYDEIGLVFPSLPPSPPSSVGDEEQNTGPYWWWNYWFT